MNPAICLSHLHFLVFTGCLLAAPLALHAQKQGSSNTSISLAMSINNLDLYSIPPVGLIGEIGLGEWGAIGAYGGLIQSKPTGNFAGNVGARFTLQLRGIAETMIFRKPLNTYGIKPYIGVAGGWILIHPPGDRLIAFSSFSPVFGLRYYPVDRWGLMVEWGETFNGATGLNVGISYGGRK